MLPCCTRRCNAQVPSTKGEADSDLTRKPNCDTLPVGEPARGP
jgi:hypothetical protein